MTSSLELGRSQEENRKKLQQVQRMERSIRITSNWCAQGVLAALRSGGSQT